MNISDLVNKYWVYDSDEEVIGPFKTKEEAQSYIDDRDDHGYNVIDWEIIRFTPYEV